MPHARRTKELLVDGGCELRGDGLDPVWHCLACEHEWGWSEVRPGGSRRMDAAEFSAALVANPDALESITGKRAMTAQEFADAAGWGLRRTSDLIRALQLVGALQEEEGPSLRATAGNRRPRWFFRLNTKT